WPAMPGRARRCRAGAEDTGAPSAWHQLLRHPPLAGEGWGGGQWVASEPTPIPAFPRRRGKGRPAVSPRPARDTRSLPRRRGGVGVGGSGSPRTRPHPGLPPQAGEGAHSRHPSPRPRHPLPPPQGGEGWGGGSGSPRIHSMDPSRSAGSGSQRLHDSPGRLRPPVHGPRLRRPREGGNIEWHRRATRGVACVVVSATACAGPQSALDPAGPAAGAIAQGWWLMATGALVAWLLVLALTALAMRRRRRLQPAAGRCLIVAGGVVLPASLLSALL